MDRIKGLKEKVNKSLHENASQMIDSLLEISRMQMTLTKDQVQDEK